MHSRWIHGGRLCAGGYQRGILVVAVASSSSDFDVTFNDIPPFEPERPVFISNISNTIATSLFVFAGDLRFEEPLGIVTAAPAMIVALFRGESQSATFPFLATTPR